MWIYTYYASKVTANYLRQLSKNQYTILNILKLLNLLKNTNTDANYEDASYDVESLFTSIPVAETTDYTLKCIYINKELKSYVKTLFLKRF